MLGQSTISGEHPTLYFRSDMARIEVHASSAFQNAEITVIEEDKTGLEKVKHGVLPPDLDPASLNRIYCVNNTFFLFAFVREKRTFQLFSASAFSDLKAWEFIGSYEFEPEDRLSSMIYYAVPYKADNFLFVLHGIHKFLPDKKNGVKFVEAHIKDNKFTLGNYICIDYDGRELIPADARPFMSSTKFPGINDAWNIQHPIIVDGYVVLVSKHMGVFWILDTEKGTIRQKKLYKELTDDHIIHQAINPIIANVCPSPDGSIIIAARPKLHALKEIGDLLPGATAMNGLSNIERRNARERLFADNLYNYPEIEWWKLDLKEGSFAPMALPPDVPMILNDTSKWHDFTFRVHPDGRVTMAK